MSDVSVFLWFDKDADEAVDFYVSTFRNAKRLESMRSSIDTPSGPAEMLLTVSFTIDGVSFTALNGGPLYQFTPAVSFMILCDDQAEVDRLWAALTSNGGAESQCGWLTDRWGVSWQIVPKGMTELFSSPDRAAAARAMAAMMPMKKLVLADIQRAFDGA